jgi:hypothetical protein
MNDYECTIRLETGITITEIISASSSLNIPTIIEERFGKKSEILYTKPLF